MWTVIPLCWIWWIIRSSACSPGGCLTSRSVCSVYTLLNLTSPSSIINAFDSFLGCPAVQTAIYNHIMISLVVLLSDHQSPNFSAFSLFPDFVYMCSNKYECWRRNRGGVRTAAPSALWPLPVKVCSNGIFLYGHICECTNAAGLDNVL